MSDDGYNIMLSQISLEELLGVARLVVRPQFSEGFFEQVFLNAHAHEFGSIMNASKANRAQQLVRQIIRYSLPENFLHTILPSVF